MVVLTYRYGALGNRLLHFAHWIAFAEEHGVSIANLAFADSAPLFAGTCEDLFCRYPLRRSRLAPSPARREHVFRLGRALRNRVVMPGALRALGFDYLPIDNYQVTDLDDPALVARARRGLLWPRGWPFRAFTSLPRHADLVRRVFTPVPSIRRTAEARLATLRAAARRLVAVHVRRGDYADYLGGRFLYTLEQYRSLVQQTAAHFGAGTRFVLCADEPLDPAAFAPWPCDVAGGTAAEDLHLMSRCDFIIGPPSTFSLWASFMGQVPLCIVRDARQPPDLAGAGCDLIENERRIYEGLIDPPGPRRDRFGPVIAASGPPPAVPMEVVVPTHNESQRLARALRHLPRQTFPADRWDILVVAGACSDRTPEVIETLRDQQILPPLRLVAARASGLPAAARSALAHSQAECLAFANAWTYPEPGWLARAHDFLQAHPEAALVTGDSRLITPRLSPAELAQAQCQFAAPSPAAGREAVPDTDPLRDVNPVFVVRRSALESVLPELPETATDELATALLRRALVRRGFELWYCPELSCERALPLTDPLGPYLEKWRRRIASARLTAGAR